MAEVIDVTAHLASQPDSDDILDSGDESGTAPEDRAFRPDVEGLRAVAVLLVVLFHSGVSGVSGGFVGVDVFFVISGFVITGVLLRERAATGGTSVLSFYGRRCRRIIPAATLVIITTVVLAYAFLGNGGGGETAIDGRWAAVFLANFHFAATGTNYLASQEPPSPLQNFWSLAVEEQFYVVYPALFLVMTAAKGLTFRIRLAIGLVAVICASLAYSIVDTNNNPVDAFFSPFTRAWELALGALVAVLTPWLMKIPARLAASSTWVGFGAILIAAHEFNSQTPYPGSSVVIPVAGTALIIAGGMQAHDAGSRSRAAVASVPVAWKGVLFALSMALAHSDHRRRVRRSVHPVGQGQPGLGPGSPGHLSAHLSSHREPNQTCDPAPARPWGKHRPWSRADRGDPGRYQCADQSGFRYHSCGKTRQSRQPRQRPPGPHSGGAQRRRRVRSDTHAAISSRSLSFEAVRDLQVIHRLSSYFVRLLHRHRSKHGTFLHIRRSSRISDDRPLWRFQRRYVVSLNRRHRHTRTLEARRTLQIWLPGFARLGPTARSYVR